MHTARTSEDDPLGWCAIVSLAFVALCSIRLGVPSTPYFDETHYVPAARDLLAHISSNREHPLFAKEILAASIALFGDTPLAWRIPATLVGALGLFAFGRLLWWISARRFAAIAGLLLMATGFLWFVQSRIAMLDIFAASLSLVALWQIAAALNGPRSQVRIRLILCGLCIGLALGSKWSALPLAVAPGLAFFALRKRVSSITLAEAALWLGLFPLATYAISFAPALFYRPPGETVSPLGLIDLHRDMLSLQDRVRDTHPYQSTWLDWIINRRPIWYLYESIDGAHRGILMIGNPLTMLAGLPAVAWCAWAGFAEERRDALALAALFSLCLGFWVVAVKHVQFYYYYLLPGTFLFGCLALALDAIWRKGNGWKAVPLLILGLSCGLFAWFFPILSAAPLRSEQGFVTWMWLDSWL